MPNHVTNIVTLKGKDDDIRDIFSSLVSDESEFDFNKIIPMPEELKNTTKSSNSITDEELIKKYKFDNWYDWSIENWETKWNAYNISVESNAKVIFETAWSCSNVLIKQLSTLHPAVEFVLTFADENIGYNCGILTYLNGEEVNFQDMSCGNLNSEEESIRWAMIIKYGSDDNYEKESLND